MPHLTAKPWHERDEVAALLENNFDAIKEEFDRVEREIKQHPQRYLVADGAWNIFSLYRNGKIEENCALCPETTRVAESLPICPTAGGQVYFSVMAAGTYVKRHYGPVNTRYRYHLGIETPKGAKIRVGKETRSWQEGKCLVFDDSFDHEVKHDGSSRRVVLIVDCWHPELTEPERDFVATLCHA